MKDGPSKIYVDNKAAVDIVNENRPTPRCRHIETQFFAVQKWRADEEVLMEHFPGVINNSDDLTKALSWVLHYRHARRSMGHFASTLAPSGKASTTPIQQAGEGIEAGEGVRARGDEKEVVESLVASITDTIESNENPTEIRWMKQVVDLLKSSVFGKVEK